MNCKITSISVRNDIRNKVKNVINGVKVSNGNQKKANTLSIVINSGFRDFAEFIVNTYKEDEISKTFLADIIKKEITDNEIKEFIERINVNQLGKYLNAYYDKIHPGINKQIKGTTHSNIFGFNGIRALKEANEYVATLLNKADWELEHNNVIDSYTIKDVIKKVKNDINENFKIALQAFAKVRLNKDFIFDTNEQINENKRNEFKILYDSYVEQDKKVTNLYNKLKELNKEINNTKDESKLSELNKNRNELINEYKFAAMTVNIYKDLLVNDYGDVQLKNQYNLFNLLSDDIDGNDYIERVLNHSRCLTVKDKFKEQYDAFKDKTFDELLDEDDIENLEKEENEYEMYRNWDNKGFKSFTEVLDKDIRTFFNSMFKMSSPMRQNSNGKYEIFYDKSNECGVPVPYTVQFVLQELMTKGKFTSIKDFINSVQEMSENIPELYGFSVLYEQLKNNYVFANHVFKMCDLYVSTKTQVVIRDGRITHVISNPNISSLSVNINIMRNEIRTNYVNIRQLAPIARLSKYKNTIVSNMPDSKFNEVLNLIIENLTMLDTHIDSRAIREYINKNNNTAINYKYKNLDYLLTLTLDIYKESENIYNKMELDEALNKYGTLLLEEYSSTNFNNVIINLFKSLDNYSATNVELNSKNAENNLSSDAIKNNFITRLMRQLENKDTAAILLEKVKQCPQYKHSIIFKGITKNIGNGVATKQIHIPGLFIENGENLTVNEEALDIIKMLYFNGIKNEDKNTAVLYNNMTGPDYYITQLISYFNPLFEANENKSNLKLKSISSFLQTPSDANKNFAIRLPKIKYDDLVSFKNTKNVEDYINKHLETATTEKQKARFKEYYTNNNAGLNELFYEMFFDGVKEISKINKDSEMFIAIRENVLQEIVSIYSQLYNVFEQNKKGEWKIKKDIVGLVENVHFKRNEEGKPVFIENGKLVGNWFTFTKIFFANNKNYGDILNNLLLYGQDKKVGLIKGNKLNQELISSINKSNNNALLIYDELNGTFSFNESNTEILKQIDDIIEDWIKDYTHDIIEKSFENSVVNESLDESFKIDEIIEYGFGDYLSKSMMCDLFFGDGKFYKDAFTFLKRAAEVQKGGITYAGFSYLDSMTDNNKTLKDKNGNDIEVKVDDKVIKVAGKPMKLTTKFRAITIYNTSKVASNAQQMYKELKDIFKKKGFSDEEAVKKAKQYATPFGYVENASKDKPITTKVNDAQSYISFEEFIRRRILDGTIDNYKSLIKEILDIRDGKKKVEDLDLNKFNAYIQVQKNFYYDLKYDSNLKLDCPRQIKNAEFVIIPELLKGTELEKVWQLMNKYDISQINTDEASKATQKNIITLWNNDGVLTEENYKLAKKQISSKDDYVEEYDYKYLYQQQDIVSHLKDKTNKFGIQFGKKILDNASPEIKEYINKFIDNYCANIKTSYMQLINNMGWKFDENGKVVDKNDKKVNLSFEEFYRTARREAQRLGKNTQFMEYLTPLIDEQGVDSEPIMPNWMNVVSDKIESIAQSIFNKYINRQVLPGFHAVQVSDVGIGVDENGKRRELTYHPQVKDKNGNVVQESYGECLVPRWWVKQKGLKEDATLEEIQAAGLDYMVGYRIPTEGKQSISILKVVGFLDDTYDSTIIVPHEWVIQTGSDMDVDTVYTITYKPKFDRNGNIMKYEVIDYNNANEETLKTGYIDYIKDIIDIREKQGFNTTVENIKETVLTKEFYNNLKEQFGDISKKYKELQNYINEIENKELKDGIKNALYSNIIRKENGKQDVIETIKRFKIALSHFKELDETIGKDILKQINTILQLNSIIKQKQNNQLYFEGAKQFAKNNNLISYEQWLSLTNEEKQVKSARDRAMLDAFIEIMKSENSREENYARSNFDDLSDAMKKLNELRGASNANRSVYNPFDQIDFMVQAQAGRVLKAFSVTRDTFGSVCNYMKARLNDKNVIKVRYDENKYDYNNIFKAYDVNIEKQTGKKVVTHDKLGWSKNNLNVVGKLITTYTSQTTAHILDVMKAGSIYNENMFTFGTFKTLIDCGVDYMTAESFLNQPAVTEIVYHYNKNTSIFISQNVKPIQLAIITLANKLGKITNNKALQDLNEFSSSYTVYEVLNKALSENKNLEVFKQMFPEHNNVNFSTGSKIENLNFVLDSDNLLKRLQKNKNSNELSDVIYDLGIAFTFQNIYRTTKLIENLTRVSNPDKFGAKQTIKSTKTVIDNINLYKEPDNATGNILYVYEENGEKVSFINALYPTDKNGEILVGKSKYPYLASYLKYSTKPSIDINTQLFKLDGTLLQDFVTEKIEKLFGRNLNDKEFNEFKKHVVNYLYRQCPILTNPMTMSLDKNNYGQIVKYDKEITIPVKVKEDGKEVIKQKTYKGLIGIYEEEENLPNVRDKQKTEIMRIFGKTWDTLNDFKIQYINDDKSKGVDIDRTVLEFSKLSPADKVLYIQNHTKDGDVNIFSHLRVSKFLDKNGNFKCIISFNDQIEDVDELVSEFEEAFFYLGNSKNVKFEQIMYRLACLDLIKYAFVVEGFRFKQRAITKIIPNNALYLDQNANGTGIITDLIYNFTNLLNSNLKENDIYESFIRANSNIVTEFNISQFRRKNIPIYTYPGGARILSNKAIEYIMNRFNIANYTELPKYIKLKENILIEKGKSIVRSSLYEMKAYDEVLSDGSHVVNAICVPIPNIDNNEVAVKYDDNNVGLYTQTNQNFTTNDFIAYRNLIFSAIDNNQFNLIDSEKSKNIISEIYNETKDKISKYIFNINIASNGNLQKALESDNPTEKQLANKLVRDLKIIIDNKEIKNGKLDNSDIEVTTRNNETYYSEDYNFTEKYNYLLGVQTVNIDGQEYTFNIKFVETKGRGVSNRIQIQPVVKSTVNNKIEDTDYEDNIDMPTDSERFSTANDISFDDINQAHNPNLTNDVNAPSIKINNTISVLSKIGQHIFDEYSQDDIYNEDFKKYINTQHINLDDIRRLTDEKEKLYGMIASSFKYQAEQIIHDLNNFEVTDENGNKKYLSFNNKEIWKYIHKNPNDFVRACNLLMKAKTFGRYIKDSIKYLKDDNKNVQSYIDIINESIISVLNSTVLHNGIVDLFDVYFARYYSTNPIIKQGIIELRTAFHDASFIDSLFSDIGELNNKQIQVMMKYVYGILNEARKIITPKVKNKFLEDYDALIKQGVDMNKIIDNETGKIRTEYTDKFIEDRNELNSNVTIARKEMYIALDNFIKGNITEEEYNVAAKKFYDAVYARKQFNYKYVNQEIVDEYYKEDLDNEYDMRKTCYNLFIKYKRLISQKNMFENRQGTLSDEEKSILEDINEQLNELVWGKFMEDPFALIDEKPIEEQEREALQRYLKKEKEINKKYFEYSAVKQWESNLNRYLEVIKNVDEANPNLTHNQKINNEAYKEAYEWILINTKYSYNEIVWSKIFEKFKVLHDKNTTNYLSNHINSEARKYDAYDKSGILDGRKLPPDKIKSIRNETITYQQNWAVEHPQLLKCIKPNKTVFIKDFYDILTAGQEKNNKAERRELIIKANNLLAKGFDSVDTTLDTVKLINALTKEEINELVELLIKIQDIGGVHKKTEAEYLTFKAAVKFTKDNNKFNEDRNKAQLAFGLNSAKYNDWLRLFTDDENGSIVASSLFYDYIDTNDESYIDKEKTEAKEFLSKNIFYSPNKYYYLAKEEAIENGTYEEWYNLNHVINPATQTWEPLQIWTELRVNPNSELLIDENGNKLNEFTYEPTFDNKIQDIKEEFKNKPGGLDYNKLSPNYKWSENSIYNSGYNFTNPQNRNEMTPEQKMVELLRNMALHYAKNKSSIKFIENGFLPRQAKMTADKRTYVNQGLGLIGLDIPKDNDTTWNDMEYIHDREIEPNMFHILKAKGYKQKVAIPDRQNYGDTQEEQERYKNDYEEAIKTNNEIAEYNIKLENNVRNNNWREVFENLIEQGEDAIARDKVKNPLFLLLEDLIANYEDGGNYAYIQNKRTGRLIKSKDNKGIALDDNYRMIPQTENIKVIRNTMHRIIYNEYKKPHNLNTVSKLAQNITSAKYMMLNLTGGIANVSTGISNILNETWAKQYLTYGDFNRARGEYFSHVFDYITDFFTGDEKSSNKTVALLKLFEVIDYDNMFERVKSDNVVETVKKTRELLYSLQSMGEHYMQNTVALGLMHSNRIYKNNDGEWEFGNFNKYCWNIDQIAIMRTIDEMTEKYGENDIAYKETYIQFINDIKNDKNELSKYDKFRKDLNVQFIRKFAKTQFNEFAKVYNKHRNEFRKKAKENFEQYKTVYDAFEFKNGYCVIDENSHLTGEMFGQFREYIISVNKKIHGVYDKYGAARIESEWWGNLLMQYHKHLYPGIMKRWRKTGYYNEIRGSAEKGSIISLFDFLSIEFDGLKDKVKENVATNDTNKAIASIQEIFKAIISTVTHVQTNWELMPDWEKANMKRLLGDLSGMTAVLCLTMALFCMTDDDEIEDNVTLSTMLYCADRCFSEAAMYFPWSLATEFKTLWSSPVAAVNGPSDLVSIVTILWDTMTDDEFNPVYTTGQYKGEYKATVKLKRNIPVYRIYNRLSQMPKNNKYYRLGQTGITKTAKKYADKMKPDK